MTPTYISTYVFPPAFSLLPSEMDSREARVLLLAIGLQESGFRDRLQHGGPARGFWQFESLGGVRGVLTHPSTSQHAGDVCTALGYEKLITPVSYAIADNDPLACAFARLLLWSLLGPLGTSADEGWRQYLKAWRPGKPRPETWNGNFTHATEVIDAES